jgi:hypothetical protein
MSFNDPLTITVYISQNDSLGEVMSRIRTWLDSQKIQAVGFTAAAGANGYTFKIGFGNPGDATRFRQHFAAPT